jgi:prepilin-type N-terminal cleavage/methylation domain-containing protein
VRRRGFTLIELLVAIAVIALLASISIPAVFAVRRRAEVKRTKTYLETIRLALENYSNDFGDYPPSRPKLVGLPSNGVNDGVECLVRCLATTKKNGPYFQFEDAVLVNTDGDSIKGGKNPTGASFKVPDLFEVKDPWENPLVYIHNADYDTTQITLAGEEHEKVKIKAIKSKATKEWLGARSFQLMSLGPNGKFDDGEDDDIVVVGSN